LILLNGRFGFEKSFSRCKRSLQGMAAAAAACLQWQPLQSCHNGFLVQK
jgi:hypothetical protein